LHAAHPGSEAIEANKFVRFDSPSNIWYESGLFWI
jgi:hypothetical protein